MLSVRVRNDDSGHPITGLRAVPSAHHTGFQEKSGAAERARRNVAILPPAPSVP